MTNKYKFNNLRYSRYPAVFQVSFILMILFYLIPLSNYAQAPNKFKTGDSLRITAPALNLNKEVTTFVSLNTKHLVVKRDFDFEIPLDQISRMEEFRYVRRTGQVALIGAAIGAVAFYPLGGNYYVDCERDCGYNSTAIFVGGALGALIGAIVGSSKRKGVWRKISVNKLNLKVSFLDNPQYGIGIAVKF